MTRAPQVIEAPRNRLADAPAADATRTSLARATWSIHVPGEGGDMPTTALAGAEVDWLERPAPRRQADGRPPVLVLTFWRQSAPGDDASRRVLAVFSSDACVGAARHTPQVASFDLAEAPSGLNLEVRCGGPVFRIAQWKAAGAAAPLAWCRSIAPSLLGLAGGQYRLVEASIEANLALRLAQRARRSREAV